MRIIAGKHKGRKIEVGKQAEHVRPTSGFTREAIFNIISHGRYIGLLNDARVADIFCGSGALGFEALSRGASHVTFVDSSHHALASVRGNAERMSEAGNVSLLRADAGALPAAREAYALIFLDPPYFGDLLPRALSSLLAQGWVDGETLLVLEHDAREEPKLPDAFEIIDERKYGRAMIRLLKRKSEG